MPNVKLGIDIELQHQHHKRRRDLVHQKTRSGSTRKWCFEERVGYRKLLGARVWKNLEKDWPTSKLHKPYSGSHIKILTASSCKN